MRMQRSTAAADAAASTGAGKIPDALANFDRLPDSAHVGSDTVLGIYGVKDLSTLWRWTKAGRIPKPRKIAGSRFNFWNVGDLRASLGVSQ